MKIDKIPLMSYVFLFTLIIGISMISAAPPTQTTILNQGYTIKIPQIDTLFQNKSYDFNFHVTNISNGIPITNATCYFHLTGNTGIDLYKATAVHDNTSNVPNEWDVTVNGNNFSYIGEYDYSIQCNSTAFGGIESVGFNVIQYPASPSSSLLSFDFSSGVNQLIIALYFAIAILLFIFRKQIFCGVMLFIAGVFMIVNGVNIVISMIIMAIGIIMLSPGDKENELW